MGVILDSSVLIAGERRQESVREILKRVQAAQGEVDSALSVVTIVELTHGIYRAKSVVDRERRQKFSEELCRDLMVYPVTLEIAQIAGQIEGEQGARGSQSFDVRRRKIDDVAGGKPDRPLARHPATWTCVEA